MNKNKREYKRIDKPLTLWLRIRPDEAQELHTDGWNRTVTKNIGAGGVFFHYNENLIIGSLIDLIINLTKTSPPVSCIGKIIRTKKHVNNPIYDIAIVFTEIDNQEKELINKVIESI